MPDTEHAGRRWPPRSRIAGRGRRSGSTRRRCGRRRLWRRR